MDRVIYSVKEWQDLGKKLFGDNQDNWEFKCPSCGHIQSVKSMRENTPDFQQDFFNYVHFSCEGRINSKFGCNWTLGGLFKIHKVEIHNLDEIHPCFEFNQ